MWEEKKIRILKNQHVYTVLWKWRGKGQENKKNLLSRLSSRRVFLFFYFAYCKNKEKTHFIQLQAALPVTGRGGDGRICRSSSSGFIDLSVQSINRITIRSGCWVASRTSLTYEWSGALWGGGAHSAVLNCAVRRRVRGQLWCRPHTLVSKRFDSSIVGIGVVVFDVRVCGTASTQLVFKMLVAEFRVSCFDSERKRETPVRCCAILLKHGLMMTEVNYHIYIPLRCEENAKE